MKRSRIPTIAGLLIIVIGLVAGIYLVRGTTYFKPQASEETSPKDVRITNISDSSFTVTWTTVANTEGFVNWGDNENSLNRLDKDEISEKGSTHSVTISGLDEDTTYYFKINSSSVDYDNNGIAWTTKTGPLLPPPSRSSIASGSILSAVGNAVPNAIVSVNVGGTSPLSTVTSENGSWVIPLSNLRVSNLLSYHDLDADSEIVEISANAGPQGTSSAQILARSANPTPTMILGETHDFKNLTETGAGINPEASLDIPEEMRQKESAFNTDEEITSDTKSVTLDSVKQGEVINTQKPQFFGDGPSGTQITITVESEPISGSTTVRTSGAWSWTPPADLEPGSHTVTLSWRDEGGVLRTITRSFTVLAADDGPAFESTPSGNTPTPTPTQTPKPASTPKATSTPISTPTSAPTLTPTPKVTPSPTSLPDAGTLTPTMALFIMGLGLMFISSTAIYLAYRRH
jgi:hypothetical protein